MFSLGDFFGKILFIFREREREGEKEGEKHRCVNETWVSCLAYATLTGDGTCYPGMCPWPGIELVILLFVGWLPANWATPVRAPYMIFKTILEYEP